MKDETDSIGEECRSGQSEIINFPTADDCMKGPKTHWVWKIVKEPSYKNWKWLIEELIRRHCGRKAKNPYEFVFMLTKEEVSGGLAVMVLWLLVTLMDDDEGQYMDLVDNGLRDQLWRGRMTNGPTMFYQAIESVSLIMEEMGRGISFWAENHKQNWSQAIDIGRPSKCK